MSKLITLIAILLLVACKSETNKDTSVNLKYEPEKEVTTQSNFSANYSSLFDSYSCDMSIAELAKVLQITASDITLGENRSAEHCVFQLKDFGNGYENTGS